MTEEQADKLIEAVERQAKSLEMVETYLNKMFGSGVGRNANTPTKPEEPEITVTKRTKTKVDKKVSPPEQEVDDGIGEEDDGIGEEEITFDMVRQAALKYKEKHGNGKAVLEELGYSKLPEIPEEDYPIAYKLFSK